MRLRVKGEAYELDTGHITIGEARLIKKHTGGMGLLDLFDGLKRGDPDSTAALVLLAKYRAGEKVNWRDLDDLDIVDDVEVEAESDGEPDGDDENEDGEGSLDPTSDSGTTRKRASSTTSRRSRSTSTSTRGRSTN